MTKKTICLAMIVKNEAHIILETLKNLTKYFSFDYWVINDNGSTDGTQTIITEYFKELDIPGELDETPWTDFAFNRTVAFNIAYKKTDYVFVWDADDEIVGNFVMPTELTADSYKFVFGNETGLRYSRMQLFNNQLKWQYIGVLHEYPQCMEKDKPSDLISGDYYFISGRKGSRSKDPNKYLKDAIILEYAFKEAYEKKDGIYNRYAFYTAQSYNWCNKNEKAIEYYKKVLTLNNYSQEKYYSCLQLYELYNKTKIEELGIYYLIESFNYEKTRIECIYRLVKHYCIKKMNEVAMLYYSLIKDYYENRYISDNISNHLFARKDEYDFYLPYYMIIVTERLKDYATFFKMYEIIFKQNYLGAGEWWIHNLFFNIKFGMHFLPTNPDFFISMINFVINHINKGIVFTDENHKNIDKIITYYVDVLYYQLNESIKEKIKLNRSKE